MLNTDMLPMAIDHAADMLDDGSEPHHQSRWERDSRYYVLQLEQDLFGDWVLTRVWGRKGTALGQLRRELAVSHEEGLVRLQKEETRRQGRGYVRTAGEASGRG
jgi:predicted DNA-binding WGR domain protein